jgi:hypothetical protein
MQRTIETVIFFAAVPFLPVTIFVMWRLSEWIVH